VDNDHLVVVVVLILNHVIQKVGLLKLQAPPSLWDAAHLVQRFKTFFLADAHPK
jgi:hypothetical protein